MKIFSAGATGVLGRRVIQSLISSGHHVVGLSRSDKNDQIINQLGAEPRHGNLFDKNSLVSTSFDCDVILHLATAIPTQAPSKEADWDLNDRIRIDGTKNLIEAAIQNNCKLYVQESITALYGNQNG
ncbi:MAG: NAD-dependent epimerase/dehydratase family protein, partial [Ignavibacteriaceae bacterium]